MSGKVREWTEAEKEKVRKLYPDKDVTTQEIADKLNRTKNSIRSQAEKMDVVASRRWREFETDFLRKHYNKDMGPADVSNELNRSKSAVKHKASKLDFTKSDKYSEEEENYLRNNRLKPAHMLANKLDRSVASVRTKLQREGWSRSEEEIKKIFEKYVNREKENNPRWEGGKVNVECAWCGEKLKRRPYRVRESKNFFCDFECLGKWRSENKSGENHPRWEGGKSIQYGKNWEKNREKRLEKDNYSCQICGMTNQESIEEYGTGLHIHHKKKFSKFKNSAEANKVSNLVSLCRECHNLAEGRDINFILKMEVTTHAI